MPIAQETQLEIDLGALESNYRYLRSRLSEGTKFLAVVKAFSYGHDAVTIAQKLATLGADYFAVAYAQEGITLRNAGIEVPILVLHPAPVNFKSIIAACLEPSLYSPRLLGDFLKAARDAKQKNYPVHLKFNTGLNRLGFRATDIGDVLAQLNGQQALKVASVFSHLAASEDLDEKSFTLEQIRQYEAIVGSLFKGLPNSPIRHLLNTSGILNYPEAQYEMVRSGIGLYGFGNEAAVDEELIPVATLKTVISQIHTIEPGESVGYNRGFVSPTGLKTATLPLGHADGIGRHFGKGKGFVYIHGQKAPIIGNVCMDMIMVDVSKIECSEGDEVIVFGKNASAEALARAGGTISYELLTGISQRIKRVIVN